jgi:hypothetical protein
VTDNASINIPRWDGRAREVAEVWRLTKGSPVAVGALWTHPSGGEAGRDGLALVNLALEWKAQFADKGWAA